MSSYRYISSAVESKTERIWSWTSEAQGSRYLSLDIMINLDFRTRGFYILPVFQENRTYQRALKSWVKFGRFCRSIKYVTAGLWSTAVFCLDEVFCSLSFCPDPLFFTLSASLWRGRFSAASLDSPVPDSLQSALLSTPLLHDWDLRKLLCLLCLDCCSFTFSPSSASVPLFPAGHF